MLARPIAHGPTLAVHSDLVRSSRTWSECCILIPEDDMVWIQANETWRIKTNHVVNPRWTWTWPDEQFRDSLIPGPMPRTWTWPMADAELACHAYQDFHPSSMLHVHRSRVPSSSFHEHAEEDHPVPASPLHQRWCRPSSSTSEDFGHEPANGHEPELTGASWRHGEEEEALWRQHGPETLQRHRLGEGLLEAFGPGPGLILGPADAGPEEEQDEEEEVEEEAWSDTMYRSSSDDHDDEQVSDQRDPEQVPGPSELTSEEEVELGVQRLMAFALRIQNRTNHTREIDSHDLGLENEQPEHA